MEPSTEAGFPHTSQQAPGNGALCVGTIPEDRGLLLTRMLWPLSMALFGWSVAFGFVVWAFGFFLGWNLWLLPLDTVGDECESYCSELCLERPDKLSPPSVIEGVYHSESGHVLTVVDEENGVPFFGGAKYELHFSDDFFFHPADLFFFSSSK